MERLGEEAPPSVVNNTSTPSNSRDPLDTYDELTVRVEELWNELRNTRLSLDSHLLKPFIRTALIRAQRDAARRAFEACKAAIKDILT